MPEDREPQDPDIAESPADAGGDGQTPRYHGPSLSFAITVAVTIAIIGAAVALIFNTFVTTRPIPAPASQEAMEQHRIIQSTSKVVFNPPALSDAPKQMREAVDRGHRILMDTRKALPEYVGNKLDCKNCHFEAGMIRKALSLIGVAAVYPKYGQHQAYSVDLAEQTNRCFEASLNGKPLPPNGKDMQAIMAYYHWISKGVPIYADVPWLGLRALQSNHKPDASKGKMLFADKCSPCHGQDGEGTEAAPPVWGAGSFSDAASMSHVQTFAAFVRAFMPKGNPDLSVDEALDVAAHVTSQPRPHGAAGQSRGSSQ